MQPVLGLIENNRPRRIDDRRRNFVATVRRKTVHEERVLRRMRHQFVVHLERHEGLLALRRFALMTHARPNVGVDDRCVTDRLHGHVLAPLAGVPHVVLDDATGKVRRFHAAWTRGAAGVAFAEGPDEALRTARRLLAGDGVGKAVP